MSDLYLAVELLEQGNRPEAVRELERILSTDIDNIAAWRLLAQAVADPLEMKECYEHILRLDPHDQEAIDALRDLGVEEAQGDIPPFFTEDVKEMGYDWLPEEPTVQPGIDTAPLKIVDAFAAVEAPVESSPRRDPDVESSKQAELALFDEEEEEVKPGEEESGQAGIFENDAFFYTAVVVIILIVAAIAAYAFRGQIAGFIQNLKLPF